MSANMSPRRVCGAATSAIAKPRRHARGVVYGLMLAAYLGLVGSAFASGPPVATGESETPSGAGTGTPSSPGTGTPSSSGKAACPSPNPPNTLTLVGGTPQTATLDTPFADGLQVALANSDGCPVTSAVAGIPITFSAPAGGASGLFSASESRTVTVGSDASGAAAAPAFTANDTAGSYTVTASSGYGTVLFSLRNVAATGSSNACSSLLAGLAGTPVKLTAGVGAIQSTPIGAGFPIRLAVTVTDAEKIPVPGAPVTFTAPARGPSGRFTTRTQNYKNNSRPRTAHQRSVTITTDTCGIAVAPAFTANRRAGGYIVTASVEHVRPAAFALVNEGPGQQP